MDHKREGGTLRWALAALPARTAPLLARLSAHAQVPPVSATIGSSGMCACCGDGVLYWVVVLQASRPDACVHPALAEARLPDADARCRAHKQPRLQ